MESVRNLLAILSIALVPFVHGDTCLAPQVTSKTYTTSESAVSVDTVFIVEFSLACKNELLGINLYADIGGRMLPATKTAETNKYQISVTDEHKKLPSGTYDVKFYDEEGFAAMRKAQRSGESAANIKPLFNIAISHGGIWTGPIVQTEFVAAMASIVVWWMAYTARSKLLA